MDKKAFHSAMGVIAVAIVFFSLYDLFTLKKYDGITPVPTKYGVIVEKISENSPAKHGEIKKGDYIEGVDHVLIKGITDINQVLQKSDKNEIAYFIRRSDKSRETVLLKLQEKRGISFFNTVSVGISFILFLISFMLLLNNPDTTEISVFYYLNIAVLIFFATAVRSYSYSIFELNFRIAGLFSIVLIPVLVFHFLSVYPYKQKFINKKPWFMPFVYTMIVSVTMLLLFLVYMKENFIFALNGKAILFLILVSCLIGGYFLVRKSHTKYALETPGLLSKIFLGTFILFGFFCIPLYFFSDNIKALQFFSFPILFFISYLAYNILKYGFVNVRVVLKKSFLYSVILIILSAIYAIFIFYINQSVTLLKLDPYVYSIGFAIIIVFFFNPLNHTIKRQLEILMFKKEKELTEKVAVNAEKLFEITDKKELEKAVLKLLKELIKKDFVLFINTEGDSYKVAGSNKVIVIEMSSDERQDILLLERTKVDDFILFYKKGYRFGYPVYKASKMKAVLLSKGHLYLEEREAIKRMLLHFITAFENARLVEKLAKQIELEKDMEIAGMIQSSLIPSTHPDNNNVQAFGISLPSKIVGGDFFDYTYFPSSNKVGLLIGDVAGKSIPAALMMVAAKEILDLQASVIPDIGKMMDEASRLIYQKSGKNMFVAACYSVISPETKKLHMVNAGMPSPLLIRENEITQLPKQKTRYPLGLLKSANYKEQVVDLKTNDTLVFFTDGVSETYDKELEKIVLSSMSSSAEVTANTIMKQLKEKSGNILEDDATVLVVNITF